MIKVSGFQNDNQADQELLKHRYGRKLIKLRKKMAKKGKLVEFQIHHDNWCPFLSGGYCTCDAEVTIMPGRFN
jgi:hypothetical protein